MKKMIILLSKTLLFINCTKNKKKMKYTENFISKKIKKIFYKMKKMIILLSITLLYINCTNKKNKDEISENFISKKIIEKNEKLTSLEKQCIVLREYLKLIPSEKIYKKNESILNFFYNKEYNLRSFESFLLLIIEQISKFHENETNFDILKLGKLFEKLKKKNYWFLTVNSKIKKILEFENFEQVLISEYDKIEFLNMIFFLVKNEFFRNFLKNIEKFDDRIDALKLENFDLIKNKIIEIQKFYIELKNLITKLEKIKSEIKNDIKNLKEKKPEFKNTIENLKKKNIFLKKLEKINFDEENDLNYEKILNFASENFEIEISEYFKNGKN